MEPASGGIMGYVHEHPVIVGVAGVGAVLVIYLFFFAGSSSSATVAASGSTTPNNNSNLSAEQLAEDIAQGDDNAMVRMAALSASNALAELKSNNSTQITLAGLLGKQSETEQSSALAFMIRAMNKAQMHGYGFKMENVGGDDVFSYQPMTNSQNTKINR